MPEGGFMWVLEMELTGGKESCPWGFHKAPEQKSLEMGLYSTLSVIWSCLSNSLIPEHICFLFLFQSIRIFSILQNSPQFCCLTTSSPCRSLPQLPVWPSLGTEDKRPSSVDYISLNPWLTYSTGLFKVLNFLKDGIMSEFLLWSSH